MKYVWGFILFMLTIALVSVCSSPAPEQPLPIKIALPKQPTSLLHFVALDQKFFETAGLAVDTHYFPSGKRALNNGLLTDSSFDLAVTADIPYIFAVQSYPHLKIFAHSNITNNNNRIIARKSAGINQPADLIGKHLATQQFSAVHYFLSSFITLHQFDSTKLTLSFLPAEALPQALFENKIDAFSMREPYISQAKALLKDDVTLFEAPGLYNQYEILVADQTKLKHKQPLFKRYIRALIKAKDFALTHPEKTTAILANSLQISTAEAENLWQPKDIQIGLEQALPLTLENELRWLQQVTETNQAAPIISTLSYFDFSILITEKPSSISIIHED